MKRVLVLGCTGSIGTNTLNIINHQVDDFMVCGLQAHSDSKKLKNLAEKYSCPSLLTSKDCSENAYQKLIDDSKPDIVVNGIAGSAGLLSSKIALESKIDIALANKETIVMARTFNQTNCKKNNVRILPVDSEHSAIFCLSEKIGKENISKILITASGGPFRNCTTKQLQNVTIDQALNHPTWKMGPKITVDSSTLANKGLEVIEAVYLFDTKPSDIEVVIHPQSLIHSMVRTNDGMIYAQISEPDMQHPILNALTWPENKSNFMDKFDLFNHEMTFYKPDYKQFPLLKYAFDCAESGNSYTIVFNAANEVAVHAFLDKKISYARISEIVASVLERDWNSEVSSYEQVFEIDKMALKYAGEQF